VNEMAEEFDIDITPQGVDPLRKGTGARGIKGTILQQTETEQVNENPAGLTKEGIEKKIELWAKSSNAHTRLKYEVMLKRCKNIQPSGKTESGLVILARSPKTGEVTWVDGVETKPEIKKQIKVKD